MTRLLAIVLLVSIIGCSERASTDVTSPAKATTKKIAPAKVEKLPLETEISRITLTQQAFDRLGITVETITNQEVSRRRTFGGDVLIPIGKSSIVSAPFPGSIVAPKDGQLPRPGQRVKVNAPVLSLAPLLTPERDVPTPAERVQMATSRATLISALTVAQGDSERAQAEVTAGKIALDRAKKLLADRVGARRDVDDAQAQFSIAEAAQKAATDRVAQITTILKDLESPRPVTDTPTSLELSAPQAGIIRNLSVTPGQNVSTGDPLFEVADNNTVWIRVPVFAELIPTITTNQPAIIVGMSGRPLAKPTNDSKNGRPIEAQPIEAPPTANALNTSVDLYYEVENTDGAFRPGQRIGMSLGLQGKQSSLTAPAKSVLYDIFGGTWVYEQTAELSFQRRRVLIRYTEGDQAVLVEGPSSGTRIVVDGAAELFGTEFGAGK